MTQFLLSNLIIMYFRATALFESSTSENVYVAADEVS